jgi:hypothetical protein
MFNLIAGNGQKILTSETYKQKASARNGIESVKKNAPVDSRYENRESNNGQFYFVLKAANHQVIGRSELYKTEASRDNGIASVKKHAPGAPTVEG